MAEAPGPSDDVPAPKRRKVMKKAKKGSTKHPKEPRPEDQDKEETSDSANPLLFFFHMKTTGYDIYKDHIIQIGAKVIGEYASYAKEQEFSCLVNTDRPIHPSVAAADHDITAGMLRNETPLEKIFPKFLQWIRETKEEVSIKTGVTHCPVLAIHKGFSHGVPLLLAEIERRSEYLKTSDLVDIFFSDTLDYLQEVKPEHDALKKVKKLALGDLYTHFTRKPYQGRQAIDYVRAMEEVFNHESLAGLLPSMPRQSAQEQLQHWEEMKKKRQIKLSLKQNLGRKIKKHQIDRLAELGLSYSKLCTLQEGCADNEKFQDELRKRGVNIKHRETLTLALQEIK